MEKITQKQFDTLVAEIKNETNTLGDMIHSAAMFAIAQANEFGNTGFGVRLIDALGKKHATKRVIVWLKNFGKFDVKSGVLVYKKRHDINETNLEAWLEKANACPWFDFSSEPTTEFTFDLQSKLESLVKGYQKAKEREEAGEKVTIKHSELLNKILEILPNQTFKIQAKHSQATSKENAEVIPVPA